MEGRGLESRIRSLDFFNVPIFQSDNGPGVDSDSNEYHGIFPGGGGGYSAAGA
jgi:hypothetical protein